jgi:chemotaxis protein MotB
MLETEAGIFFESGRPLPSERGAELLKRLAEELARMPNHLLIEGHTDAKPFGGDGAYTNWELSSDRANAARRLMEAYGVRREQVGQVRGFADRQLRHPEDPEHASNRRIWVIVQYLTPPPGPPADDKKTEGKKAEEKKSDEKKPEEKKPPPAAH